MAPAPDPTPELDQRAQDNLKNLDRRILAALKTRRLTEHEIAVQMTDDPTAQEAWEAGLSVWLEEAQERRLSRSPWNFAVAIR